MLFSIQLAFHKIVMPVSDLLHVFLLKIRLCCNNNNIEIELCIILPFDEIVSTHSQQKLAS